MIDLSLAIPCYNEASHLRESVRTLIDVLENTSYSYEVIFVEDRSKDNTYEILEELCKKYPKCRVIRHEKNKGRGAAFKTGYAAATGRVTGYLDIDLEVHPHYIPSMVRLIDKEGYDVATGLRYYVLSQTGGWIRHILSHGYRVITRNFLGLGIKDSETGYKFFKRRTTQNLVLGSESDGWFWDTEVMVRAVLKDLKIYELPVLFLRKYDKKSTVRIVPDSIDYLKDLVKLRPKIGLSYLSKSPIYWWASVYEVIQKILLGKKFDTIFSDVAAQIPENTSVTEVCCGTGKLYRDYLKKKHCDYLGLDFNSHFVLSARKKGINAQFIDLRRDEIKPADTVVMTSSLYHFYDNPDMVFEKVLKAARQQLIISEPVKNLSSKGVIGRLINKFTNPGVGSYQKRFDLEKLKEFAQKKGATRFIYKEGMPNAQLVFEKTVRPPVDETVSVQFHSSVSPN